MTKFAGYRDQMAKEDKEKKQSSDGAAGGPVGGGFASSLGKLVGAIAKKRESEDSGMDTGLGTGEDVMSGMDYRDAGISPKQEEEPIESPEEDLAQFDPRSILERELNGKEEMKRGARARAVFGGPRNESYFK